MWQINGGKNEHMAALAVYGASDSHVLELLLVLLVDDLEIVAGGFLVQLSAS
jgi:hypothetical protein